MPGISTLLDGWISEPGQPRLTWYGTGGERVELTGRVLANWVSKAANLLADEADLFPGGTLRLDLPAHWRSAVWALAAWACGASVSTGRQAADVLVTTPDRLAPDTADGVTIVIALPALAMSTDGVPPGGLDGAAELMSQPDVLLQPVPEGHGANLHTGAEVRDLLGRADGGRVLLDVRGLRSEQLLTDAVAAWAGGGSIVLVDDPDADLARLAAQEGTDSTGVGGPT